MMRKKPATLTVPASISRVWSTDFVHEQLSDGRYIRLFNVIADFNRKALGVDVDLSLPPERVVLSLDRLISRRGCLRVIRCANWPKYISAALQGEVNKRGIRLKYTQPGKPQQNAYVERFNRTVRHERLTQYLFDTVGEV